MIKIIAGEKGEGKTKQLINMANEAAKTSSGHVVFVDDDKRHIYDLNHSIRFIKATDFPIEDDKEFFGFLCGILSEDHDIDQLYIDGLLKVSHLSLQGAAVFLEKLKNVSEKYNTRFIISINCKDRDVPENLKPFLVA
jgi:hypothetical protein